MQVQVQEVVAFLNELSLPKLVSNCLLFSFDGAARGNPGPSSPGVCAWWGYFDRGAFHPKDLFVQRGTRLATSTSNTPEAHGLASALKSCLRYFFWMLEQITEHAQHSVI